MACAIPTEEQRIGGDGLIYAGENRILRWRIRDKPLDQGGVLLDIAGWNTVFTVKRSDYATAYVIQETGTIIGTFNADETLNTQYVEVELDASQMDIDAPREYRYSLKRTDAGFEDVLRTGPFEVQLAA